MKHPKGKTLLTTEKRGKWGNSGWGKIEEKTKRAKRGRGEKGVVRKTNRTLGKKPTNSQGVKRFCRLKYRKKKVRNIWEGFH